MVSAYWQQVQDEDLRVPTDRRLDDLTAELTTMLGSTDPDLRDEIAYPVLATWIERGVYDDLLAGLGDGMAAGLLIGLGEHDTDTVFRRSFSALVLAESIERDNKAALVPPLKVLEWGDRITAWFVRERDVRGFVPGKGWAHAVAHGADAIGCLARSPHFWMHELTVLLDVIADRLLLPSSTVYTAGEPDRLAAATMAVLRRNLVPFGVVEPWVARLSATAASDDLPSTSADPFLRRGNPEAFLRALHLQLLLSPEPPEIRSDLLLVLGDALRAANPAYLGRAQS
ncbi:DUF2785 domain-containing protein [Nocardioides bigeumensis]|jgi:hypothetical protein|uniref:DUF2785 domain-containing protein n=1 Tax=Nocardioides bigeumensis TaxID=433657 RepID=A0ABN2YBP6_9ACTN